MGIVREDYVSVVLGKFLCTLKSHQWLVQTALGFSNHTLENINCLENKDNIYVCFYYHYSPRTVMFLLCACSDVSDDAIQWLSCTWDSTTQLFNSASRPLTGRFRIKRGSEDTLSWQKFSSHTPFNKVVQNIGLASV